MTRKSLRCLRSTTTGFLARMQTTWQTRVCQGSREKVVFPKSHTRYPVNHSPRSCSLGTRKTRASLLGLDLLLSVLAAREVHDMVCNMVNHESPPGVPHVGPVDSEQGTILVEYTKYLARLSV